MNLRKYSLMALMLPLALSMSGCLGELDNKFPETSVNDINFWKTESHLIMATNYLYTFLPGITENNNANWSDDGRSTGSNAISDGSWTVPSTTGDYSNPYQLIRAANNIIEKAEPMEIDADAKARYVAETRFFRAYAYADLLKRYGGVPLILRTLQVGDPLLMSKRASRDDIANAIYADLDFAIETLPRATTLANAQFGRITKGAAQALKVRVALFEGTFRKYHSLNNPDTHLQLAKDVAGDMIEENDYSLFRYGSNDAKSYYYLFQPEGNGNANKENVLVRLYGESLENSISSHLYSRNLEQGSTTPTRSLADAYLYKDGLPRTGSVVSPLYKPDVNTMSEFDDRDPRMAMTFFQIGDVYINGGTYNPSFAFTQTGYKTYKYFNAKQWMDQAGYTHHKVIRYAEVLLSYAEATYELSGNISDGDLNKSINVIRNRAGMPDLTNAFVTGNGLSMLEEIRRERRVELAIENGHRYWDIIRWKIAENVLPQAQKGVKYFAADYAQPLDNPNLDENGYIIAQPTTSRTFNPQRDYLWPLPTTELGLNPDLEQNPEWR